MAHTEANHPTASTFVAAEDGSPHAAVPAKAQHGVGVSHPRPFVLLLLGLAAEAEGGFEAVDDVGIPHLDDGGHGTHSHQTA